MNTATLLVILIGGGLILTLLIVLLVVRMKGHGSAPIEESKIVLKGDLSPLQPASTPSIQSTQGEECTNDEDTDGVDVLYAKPKLVDRSGWFCNNCGIENSQSELTCKVCGTRNATR